VLRKCPCCGSHETLVSIIASGEEVEVASNHSSGAISKEAASCRLRQIHDEAFETVARRLGGAAGTLLKLKQIMGGGLLKDQDICAQCGVVFYPNINGLRDQAERFRDEMRKKHPLDSLILETDRPEDAGDSH
jgi:hypothetical protein